MKLQNLFAIVFSGLIFVSGCTSTPTVNNDQISPNRVSLTNNKINDCALEVAKIKLTKEASSAYFTTDVITPEGFNHNYRVITIDASAFDKGGVMTITGKVGTQDPSASFGLLTVDANFKCKDFQDGLLGSSANVKPGGTFTVTYNFSSGQVFRLGAEGSWGGIKDSKNTVDLNVSIQ